MDTGHIEEVTTTTARRVVSGNTSTTQRSRSQSLTDVNKAGSAALSSSQPPSNHKLMDDPYAKSDLPKPPGIVADTPAARSNNASGGAGGEGMAYEENSPGRYSNLRSSSKTSARIPTPPAAPPHAPRSRANSISNISGTNTPVRRSSSLDRRGGSGGGGVAPLNTHDLSYASTSYAGSTTSRGYKGGGHEDEDHHLYSPIFLASRHYDTALTPSMPIAILDTTPDEWFHEYQAMRAEAAEAKEEERQRVLQQKKEETGGGVGFKIGKFFSNTTASIKGSVKEAADSREATVWENHRSRARTRLAKYWSHINAEDFIVEFDCEGLHNNKPIKGHLLLTKTMLCFRGKCRDDNILIVDSFPLVELASYTKGVSVPCVDHHWRWVMDIPNELVKPDAVQLYMREGQLHHFLNIVHPIIKGESTIPGTYVKDGHEDIQHLDRFINYLDHAWRAACGWSPRPSFGGEH